MADHETLAIFEEVWAAENDGSGVGARAVFGVELSGIAEGTAVGPVDSNDHSWPVDGTPDVPVSNAAVPNDIGAV